MSQTQSPTTATPPQSRTNNVPPYQIPSTPEQAAREQERVNLLMDINSEIFEHVNQLQGDGHGGSIGQNQNMPPAAHSKQASPEYISCMKVVQCNMAWIACAIQGGGNQPSRTSHGPLIMDTPIREPSLVEKYEQLKQLFPNWKPPSQGPQRQQSSSNTPPQPQNQTIQNQALHQVQPQQFPTPQGTPGMVQNMPSQQMSGMAQNMMQQQYSM